MSFYDGWTKSDTNMSEWIIIFSLIVFVFSTYVSCFGAWVTLDLMKSLQLVVILRWTVSLREIVKRFDVTNSTIIISVLGESAGMCAVHSLRSEYVFFYPFFLFLSFFLSFFLSLFISFRARRRPYCHQRARLSLGRIRKQKFLYRVCRKSVGNVLAEVTKFKCYLQWIQLG